MGEKIMSPKFYIGEKKSKEFLTTGKQEEIEQ